MEVGYSKASQDPTVLKIFNAPEFFFRGPYGAYDFSSIVPSTNGSLAAIGNILSGLEGIAADKKYEDWLFVFGTIIASESELGNFPAEGQTNATLQPFYNFAPVLKGYDPSEGQKPGMKFILPKTYISGIDFLTSNRAPATTTEYDDPKLEAVLAVLNDELQYTVAKNSFLVIDDVLFAVEICLDHLNKVAKTNFAKWLSDPSAVSVPAGGAGTLSYPYENQPPPGLPQLQIITSSGMKIFNDSVLVGNGGDVVLQDGGSKSGTCSGRGEDEPATDSKVAEAEWFNNGTQSIDGLPSVQYSSLKRQYPTGTVSDSNDALLGYLGSGEACVSVYDPVPLGDLAFPPTPAGQIAPIDVGGVAPAPAPVPTQPRAGLRRRRGR